MDTNKNKAFEPTVAELVNNISGTYSAPFWDGLLEVSGSLDTIRNVQAAISALNSCGKYMEAYQLIITIYELIALEVPSAISALEPYPKAVEAFIDEFLLDIEDLMYDYEYEEQHPDETYQSEFDDVFEDA